VGALHGNAAAMARHCSPLQPKITRSAITSPCTHYRQESEFIRETYPMQELGAAVAVYRSTLHRRVGLISEW